MKRLRSFAFFAVLLTLVSGGFAQTEPATEASTSPTTVESQPTASFPPTTGPNDVIPVAIPLTETASNAEAAAITLKRMEQELNGDYTADRVDEELKNFISEIDARRDEVGRLLASNPSLQTLQTLDTDWHGFADQLESYKRDVARRQAQLQHSMAELKQMKANWDLTETTRKSRNITRADAIANIQATLDLNAYVASRVHDQRKRLFLLNNKIDAQSARVIDVLAFVEESRQQAFERLFMRDSPPVWSAGSGTGGVVGDTHASLIQQFQAMRAYAWRQHERFALHVLVLVILAVGLFWTRRRIATWGIEDAAIHHALAVFDTPIATALLLALLGSTWIYPQAPRLLWAFVGAASLIPTILILRRLIESRLYSILNALVAFYFFDQLRSVEASELVLSRWLFLIEMAAGCVILISFLTRSRLTEKQAVTDRLTRWVRVFAKAGIAVFTVAFFAGALGYVAFANLIGDAMLGSAYLAVMLFAAMRIIDGLVLIALRARPLSLLGMVRHHHRLMQRRISGFLHFVIIVVWALGTLELLSLRTPVFDALHTILTHELSVGSFSVTLGNVLSFGIAVWASFLVSRFLRFVLEEDVYQRFALPSGTPYAISRVLHYSVLTLGFFIAVAALGYDMTKFTILAGAFGVGLGFGMQNIVNNFVSGLILLFERPVRVGDVIELDSITGVVVRIGIRASVIRTAESSEIIIPNGRLISDRVCNWTLSNRQRGIEIFLSIAAGTDPRRVIQLLEKVAAANPMVTDIPRPHATFVKFGGDAFSFTLSAWTNKAEEWESLRSDLSVAINDALNAEKIPIRG